jgi:hypothetical protein
MLLRNVFVNVKSYTMSKPRWLSSEQSLSCKLDIWTSVINYLADPSSRAVSSNLSYMGEPPTTETFTGEKKFITGSAVRLLVNYDRKNLFVYIIYVYCKKWSIFPVFQEISLNFSWYSKISKLLHIYPTVSRPNLTDVLRNSSPRRKLGCATLVQGAEKSVHKQDLKPRKMEQGPSASCRDGQIDTNEGLFYTLV